MSRFERWMAAPAAMVLVGLAGAVNKIINGEHALGTTAAMPWGLLIAGYVFFAAAATGAGLIASLGHFSGKPALMALERRGMFLALSLLIPGFGLIGIELGNPLNMIYILLSPNFTSGIWWMGFLYSIYLALLLIECYYSQVNPTNKNLKMVSALAVLNKIAAVCNLGAIFALAGVRLFWNGYYFPIYILVTAILSGAAALLTASYLTGKRAGLEIEPAIVEALGKIMAGCIVIAAAMTALKLYANLQAAEQPLRETAAALVSGPLAWRFWLGEVGAGMLLPLALLLIANFRAKHTFAAAVLILIGVFAMRADFIAAGQIIPQVVVEGVQHTAYHVYSATWTEWALLAGATGASVLMYAFAEYKFTLDAEAADTFADPECVADLTGRRKLTV
ncbi:MAG: polysulfide reductase NrfD [Negativicutes bacterium]|nr:polysulfide reductase NrfD [Negativicutes bacterium]